MLNVVLGGLVLVFVVIATGAGAAATRRAQPAASGAAASASHPATTFPASWVGRWKGDVEVLGTNGDAPKFTKELVIAPTEAADRFTWTIIYEGASGRQERPYTLVVKDAAAGLYEIDEKNGIVLPSRMLGGVMHTAFTVQGARITTREEVVGAGTSDERMLFELATFSDDQPIKTGGGDAPEVLGWRPTSVQRATLRRVVKGSAAGGGTAALAAGEKPQAAAPAAAAAIPAGRDAIPSSRTAWTRFVTQAYRGKQDDAFFISPSTGWYVNGAGKIFKTTNFGATWTQTVKMDGAYFRRITFIDEKIGFAGNIGPGYFPSVSIPVPLYRTEDGGETWSAVTTIKGPAVVGLCALEVVRVPFVNAGNLEYCTRIVGVGRVGGPTAMVISDDLGKTWQHGTLPESCVMAFDVHFFDLEHGVVAAASSDDVSQSRALILTTSDGGKTWKEAFGGGRDFELAWKMSFPSREVGYVTIQSYNPDASASARLVAKTIDEGKTWAEMPLVDDHKVGQFGVAFVDENRGWVGGMPGGFETADGGKTWMRADFGNAVNKIRVLRTQDATHLHAIGVNVSTLTLPK